MRRTYATILAVACPVVTAGLVVLLLIPAGPSTPPEFPTGAARPAPALHPRPPRVRPPEIFGIDPASMLLYSEEQLRRDTEPRLRDELRRLDIPATFPLEQ